MLTVAKVVRWFVVPRTSHLGFALIMLVIVPDHTHATLALALVATLITTFVAGFMGAWADDVLSEEG